MYYSKMPDRIRMPPRPFDVASAVVGPLIVGRLWRDKQDLQPFDVAQDFQQSQGLEPADFS